HDVGEDASLAGPYGRRREQRVLARNGERRPGSWPGTRRRGRRRRRVRLRLDRPTERGGELVPVGEAILATLRERFADDRRERGRDARELRRDVARRLVNDSVEDGRDRVAAEGLHADEHLVEDDAQGEQVGATVQGLTPYLLGGHVV